MPAFNSVIIVGNITRDIEVKYLPKGTAVGDLSIAVNRTWKTDSGEKREEVTFVDVTVFGRTAEIVSEYTKKGDPILVSGELRQERWDDKQSGTKRSKLKVIANDVTLLGSKGGNAPVPSVPEAKMKAGDPALNQDSDDIPF